MLTRPIAALLRSARLTLGLTQKELARRAGVSHRLWAEVERGERPNVSLETALRMLAEVGITLRLTDPLGAVHVVRSRAATRAAVRRTHWPVRRIRLDQEGSDAAPAQSGRDGVRAVGQVTEQAYAVARPRRAAARRR